MEREQTTTQAEYNPLAAAIMQVVDAVVDVVVTIAKNIIKAFTSLWERALEAYAAAVLPKWLYYYKHSKKRRVRKKYYNLIKRQFFRVLLIDTSL